MNSQKIRGTEADVVIDEFPRISTSCPVFGGNEPWTGEIICNGIPETLMGNVSKQLGIPESSIACLIQKID